MVKYMRSVKKVALRLVETFADKCDDPSVIATMVSDIRVTSVTTPLSLPPW